MNPRRVPCPTCGAPANTSCHFPDLPAPLTVYHGTRIGAAEARVHGSPDAAALASVRGPADQSLPPERDPVHVRPDRPVDRGGNSHDAYGDDS